jgi:hypothetical protein
MGAMSMLNCADAALRPQETAPDAPSDAMVEFARYVPRMTPRRRGDR